MTNKALMTRIAAFAIAGAAVCVTPVLAQTEPSAAPQASAEAPANAVQLTGKIAAAGQAPGTFTLEVGEAPAVKSIAVDASAATSDGQPFAIGDTVTVTGELSADQTALKASAMAKNGATAEPAAPEASASSSSEASPQ